MTRAAFDALSHDEAFDLCFPKISDESPGQDLDFDIEQAPYILQYRSYGMYGGNKYSSKKTGTAQWETFVFGGHYLPGSREDVYSLT